MKRKKTTPLPHWPIPPSGTPEYRRWLKQLRADREAAERMGAGDLLLVLAAKCRTCVAFIDPLDRSLGGRPITGPDLIVFSKERHEALGAASVLMCAARTTEKIDYPAIQTTLTFGRAEVAR